MSSVSIEERKKVSFNEGANSQGESAYNAEESTASWLQEKDYQKIGYDVHTTSLAVKFKQSLDNPTSYSNTLSHVYNKCMEGALPSSNAFKYYVHWNRACPERRGIEQYCVPALTTQMRESSSDSVFLVLALQAQLVLQQRLPFFARSERLSEVYKEAVQSHRIFARIQGIADATVCKHNRIITPCPHEDRSNVASLSQHCSVSSLTTKRSFSCHTESSMRPLKKRRLSVLKTYAAS